MILKKETSIKKNFVMNTILTMSSFIFSLLSYPYVSRVLAPEGIGKVSFALSVVSYFSLFAQLGIPTYGVRICAQVRDDKEKLSRTVQELFLINLSVSVIVGLSFVVCTLLVPRFYQDRLLFFVIGISILLNSIGMEWLYKALEQYTYITICSVAFKLIAMVLMFLLIQNPEDYVIYGGISIFASSASNILNLINAHKFVIIKPLKGYNLKRHFTPVVIFFAMSCATTIYTHLDTTMLGFMKGDVEVGYYDAAIRIKNILVSVVTSFGVVLLPRVSYYIEKGMEDDFLVITKKVMNFIFIIACPMVLYFICFAKNGIFFLCGSSFEGAIKPMQILMPTVLLIGLTNIMGIQMLVPLGKEKIVLLSEVLGAVVDLIINLILIPGLGVSGAAIGTLIAEGTVWVVQYFALKDKVKDVYKRLDYKKIFICLFFAIISSIWIKWMKWSDFVSLLISVVIFFGVYACGLIFTKVPLALDLKKEIGKMIKNSGFEKESKHI